MMRLNNVARRMVASFGVEDHVETLLALLGSIDAPSLARSTIAG
jgi:hypothetical protein